MSNDTFNAKGDKWDPMDNNFGSVNSYSRSLLATPLCSSLHVIPASLLVTRLPSHAPLLLHFVLVPLFCVFFFFLSLS